MPRTADPSLKAVRDDRFRGCLWAGVAEHKWLERRTDASVCLFQPLPLVIPNPALSVEGSAFCDAVAKREQRTRTADPRVPRRLPVAAEAVH